MLTVGIDCVHRVAVFTFNLLCKDTERIVKTWKSKPSSPGREWGRPVSLNTITPLGSIAALMEFTLRYWELWQLLQHVATCFIVWASDKAHPPFSPVTHWGRTQNNNVALVFWSGLFFLNIQLISEVLRKIKHKKNYTISLLQMVNLSTPSSSYIHIAMS